MYACSSNGIPIRRCCLAQSESSGQRFGLVRCSITSNVRVCFCSCREVKIDESGRLRQMRQRPNEAQTSRGNMKVSGRDGAGCTQPAAREGAEREREEERI